MASAIAAGGDGLKNIRVSLSMFKEKDAAVYERALALLPEGFRLRALPEATKLCQNAQCLFGANGGRAQTKRDDRLCLLCDPTTPTRYEADGRVRSDVNLSLIHI